MRKAPIVTREFFKEKMVEFHTEYDPPYKSKKVEKDLEKVEFDWENFDVIDSKQPITILRNRLPVCWMYAGGDWEYPVHFILYWNGKNVRAYIPNEGNIYNRKHKSALGNHDEETESEDIKPDFIKMENDIINRIQII